MCEGQRITYAVSSLLPLWRWLLGAGIKLSGSVASAFTHWAISPAHVKQEDPCVCWLPVSGWNVKFEACKTQKADEGATPCLSPPSLSGSHLVLFTHYRFFPGLWKSLIKLSLLCTWPPQCRLNSGTLKDPRSTFGSRILLR